MWTLIWLGATQRPRLNLDRIKSTRGNNILKTYRQTNGKNDKSDLSKSYMSQDWHRQNPEDTMNIVETEYSSAGKNKSRNGNHDDSKSRIWGDDKSSFVKSQSGRDSRSNRSHNMSKSSMSRIDNDQKMKDPNLRGTYVDRYLADKSLPVINEEAEDNKSKSGRNLNDEDEDIHHHKNDIHDDPNQFDNSKEFHHKSQSEITERPGFMFYVKQSPEGINAEMSGVNFMFFWDHEYMLAFYELLMKYMAVAQAGQPKPDTETSEAEKLVEEVENIDRSLMHINSATE